MNYCIKYFRFLRSHKNLSIRLGSIDCIHFDNMLRRSNLHSHKDNIILNRDSNRDGLLDYIDDSIANYRFSYIQAIQHADLSIRLYSGSD